MTTAPPARVAAVVLAAGASRRLGRPKQLLPWHGRSLLRHVAQEAASSQAASCFVVLGCNHQELDVELKGLDVELVRNEGWREGMASSIRAGVEAACGLEPRPDAVALIACDQPHVSHALIDSLIRRHEQTHASIVACEYAGTVGVPALFARLHFEELLSLTGDRGAKGVIAAHLRTVARLPFPEGRLDIDIPADLDHLES
ncbi:MAG: nucleotidyltransferase family protein [Planctomycetota bacterium]